MTKKNKLSLQSIWEEYSGVIFGSLIGLSNIYILTFFFADLKDAAKIPYDSIKIHHAEIISMIDLIQKDSFLINDKELLEDIDVKYVKLAEDIDSSKLWLSAWVFLICTYIGYSATQSRRTRINNEKLNGELKEIHQDTKSIIDNLSSTNELIFRKSYLSDTGKIALLAKPIQEPQISKDTYRDCRGVLDVITPNNFEFQDLLLCDIYMKYMIIRANSVVENNKNKKFMKRLIVANRNELESNNKLLTPFKVYLRICDALGYDNFIVDRNTYTEVFNTLYRTKNKGFNKNNRLVLEMQPSITIGLSKQSNPSITKDLFDYIMLCTYKDIKDPKAKEKKLNEQESKRIFVFLNNFLVKGINDVSSEKADLDFIYSGISSRKNEIIKKIEDNNNNL